jgi:hypothetical protein
MEHLWVLYSSTTGSRSQWSLAIGTYEPKIDFFRSREVVLSVDPGETKHFVCAAGAVTGMPPAGACVRLWEGQLTEAAPPAI